MIKDITVLAGQITLADAAYVDFSDARESKIAMGSPISKFWSSWYVSFLGFFNQVLNRT